MPAVAPTPFMVHAGPHLATVPYATTDFVQYGTTAVAAGDTFIVFPRSYSDNTYTIVFTPSTTPAQVHVRQVFPSGVSVWTSMATTLHWMAAGV